MMLSHRPGPPIIVGIRGIMVVHSHLWHMVIHAPIVLVATALSRLHADQRQSGGKIVGLVTYTNSMKHALLAVSTDLLNREGAVHPDVALAMAGGVRQTTGASVSLATTGVAGPGPADGHPAGRAYIAVLSPEFTAVREVNCDPGDQGASQRNAIRRCVVYEAVALLAEALAVPNREKQM